MNDTGVVGLRAGGQQQQQRPTDAALEAAHGAQYHKQTAAYRYKQSNRGDECWTVERADTQLLSSLAFLMYFFGPVASSPPFTPSSRPAGLNHIHAWRQPHCGMAAFLVHAALAPHWLGYPALNTTWWPAPRRS